MSLFLLNPEVRNKFKQTCFEKYGVEQPSHNNDIKLKKQETCFNN